MVLKKDVREKDNLSHESQISKEKILNPDKDIKADDAQKSSMSWSSTRAPIEVPEEQ